MNILIIGGSGLLGTHIAREALKRGHAVTILSRGREGAGRDGRIRAIVGDVYDLPGERMDEVFSGQDAVVYALGIDDRRTHPRPAYPIFHKDHVEVCMRMLVEAKKRGASKFLVLGSYFTYFARRFPGMDLVADHIYVRTREEQRQAVLKAASPGFETYVLELPYILGSLEGRVPPWTFLFSMLAARGKFALFFAKGGTAAVTASQVGRAALGAIEGGVGGTSYPLGGKNYAWTDFAKAYAAATGREKAIVPLPAWLFRAFGALSSFFLRLSGRERGLDIGKFAAFQYMDAYIDPADSMAALGYGHEDYDAALAAVIAEWRSVDKRPRRARGAAGGAA